MSGPSEILILHKSKVRMKMCRRNRFFKSKRKVLYPLGMTVALVLVGVYASAQNGSQGIQDANTMVRGYFVDGTNLMYAVGAIVGLIGAVRVYQKWSSGDPDTGRTAAAWFGSCIFLVIVATVLKSFFGV
jgi:hypothetical protein